MNMQTQKLCRSFDNCEFFELGSLNGTQTSIKTLYPPSLGWKLPLDTGMNAVFP